MIVWLFLGCVVGAAAAGLAVRMLLRGRISEATARIEQEAQARRVAEQGRSEEAERAGELEREMLRRGGTLNAQIARLEAELDGERKSAGEKLKTLTEAREGLLALVKASAAEALDERGKSLLDSLKAELKTVTVKSEADLSRRQKAVEEVIAPVKETLIRMGSTLEKVDQDRRRTHTELSERLRGMVEAQKELRNEAGALVRALRQPHTRGRWGELHLRRIAELAGMSSLCDFSEQVSSTDEEGDVLRPDMIVHLPGQREVVVDSKAPVAAYLDACEATDEAARVIGTRNYARALRAHVRKLSSKAYGEQFDTALDFVVMYLPGEHFFSAAVEADTDLIEDAARQSVLIASPTTLIVLLKTIAHAWQQERVGEQAQEVAQLGRQLYDRLSVYVSHVDNVGKRLTSAVQAHNKAVGSLQRTVLPSARRFQELGPVPEDKEISAVRLVEPKVRDLILPELELGEDEVDDEEAAVA